MAYIYKVTNKTNGTVYIGQTRITIEQRWRDHCRVSFSKTSDERNFPLHAAIRKYGIDNFEVIEIEECEEAILDEREIYWIAQYDSYHNGYNASLGGDGHVKYDYDQIVKFYLENNYSIKMTCQHFGLYDQVVYSALRSRGIDYKALPKNHGKKGCKKILMVETGMIFNSMKEIDDYFNKQVHGNIRRCLNGMTKKAYGYTWKEIEEENE